MFDVISKKNPSISKLAKETDFHPAHTGTVLREFQKENLIKPIFDTDQAEHQIDPGNPYKIELTLKGRLLNEVLRMFQMIKDEVGIIELMKKLNIRAERGENNGK